MRQEEEKSRAERLENGETREQLGFLHVPAIPYWRCRQIMTRPDFLEGVLLVDIQYITREYSLALRLVSRVELDNDNIISIDVGAVPSFCRFVVLDVNDEAGPSFRLTTMCAWILLYCFALRAKWSRQKASMKCWRMYALEWMKLRACTVHGS